MRLNYLLPMLFLLLLPLAGCASKNDLEYLRSDFEELKSRLFQNEKEMGNLRSETREGVEKNLKGLQDDMASMRKREADNQAALDSVKVDMQVLAGKLDDASLAAKKPIDDLSLLKDDVNRRFTALEGRVEKLEQSVEEQKKAAQAKPENPDELYQKGVDTIKGGDAQKARELLTRFIEQNPNHAMVANAHYWLGETYYSEKNYDQAILEFQEIIKNFPDKEKVPAAELKQGMAFKELGDLKSARYLFKKVIDDFPASDEAKLAKEKLKSLK
jgi:tol-pal system protein YbgF